MNAKEQLKITGFFLRAILRDIFTILLVTYVSFLLIEKLFVGMVSSYINLDSLLLIIILCGAITVSFENNEKKNQRRIRLTDIIFLMAILLGSFAILFTKLKVEGNGGYLFTIFLSVLIVVSSWLTLKEN